MKNPRTSTQLALSSDMKLQLTFILMFLLTSGIPQTLGRDTVNLQIGNSFNVLVTCSIPMSRGISWKKELKTIIAYNDTVDTSLTFKYEIKKNRDKNVYDLLIKNFTLHDQGKYTCTTEIGGTLEECGFNLSICDVPGEVEAFRDIINTTIYSEHQNLQTNLLCRPATQSGTVEQHSNMWIKHLDIGNGVPYTCLTLNQVQCRVSEGINITLNWKYSRLDKRPYKFKCVSGLNDSSDRSSHEITVFARNDSFYLMNVKSESNDCYLGDAVKINGSMDGVAINNHIPILVSAICMVSVVLVITTILALQRGIKFRRLPRDEANQQQEPIEMGHQQYSTVERQQNQESRQPVTYAVSSRHFMNREEIEENLEEIAGTSGMKIESPNLNYVEVEIGPYKSKRPTITIRNDKMTPYADIDFALKADPLPDDDSVTDELPDKTGDDGFMTFEELEELREKIGNGS